MSFKGFGVAVAASGLLLSGAAHALVIDNDIPLGTLGAFQVDVRSGGQTRDGTLTAQPAGGGSLVTDELIFDYFTYIQTGQGSGFQLPTDGAVNSIGNDAVRSSGTFTGSAGNTISWTVDSTIADGTPTLQNAFTFSATEGTLGTLRLFQYLDEDVASGPSDDVFFTRGSVAELDLELFTVDGEALYGINHSGAFGEAQGLVNATFAGWAVCDYNTQKPDLQAGTQAVSLSGDVCAGLGTTSIPDIGTVLGPRDIVSVLAWDVLINATSATIITTLGGLPDINEVPGPGPGPDPVPAPAALGLFGLGVLGLGALRRRRAK